MRKSYSTKGRAGRMNKKQIEQALRDYLWMMNEIIKEREELNHIIGGNVVAKITDMPKASGGTSDPVANEVIRRTEKSRRIEKLEKKVLFVQSRTKAITEERELTVLNCMLDGMSMRAIGHHMGLSRQHIYRLKESIIEQMLHM